MASFIENGLSVDTLSCFNMLVILILLTLLTSLSSFPNTVAQCGVCAGSAAWPRRLYWSWVLPCHICHFFIFLLLCILDLIKVISYVFFFSPPECSEGIFNFKKCNCFQLVHTPDWIILKCLYTKCGTYLRKPSQPVPVAIGVMGLTQGPSGDTTQAVGFELATFQS